MGLCDRQLDRLNALLEIEEHAHMFFVFMACID